LDLGDSVLSVGDQLLCGEEFSFLDLCLAFISFLYKFMSVRPSSHVTACALMTLCFIIQGEMKVLNCLRLLRCSILEKLKLVISSREVFNIVPCSF
jgi:hypothetical protein